MQGDGAVPPQIAVQNRVTVTPSSPSKAENLFLSPLDIFWHYYPYNKVVIFYDNQAAAAVKDPVGILKRSLSDVMVHYYPWSRRISMGNDDKPFINCNEIGVEMVEATMDFPISNLAAHGYQLLPWYEQLCQSVDNRASNTSRHMIPLLAVQVTRFSDGGLAVGITHSNMVADGQSLWNFLVAWGECARGQAISVPPMHNRRQLALTVPLNDEKAKEFSLHPDIKPEDYEGLADEDEFTGTVTTVDPEHAGLVNCLFDMSGENITKLKVEAGGGFTNFEVLCAYFWQRTTVARKLPPKTPLSFSLLANIRNILTPPLPPSYFGNAVALCPVGATAGKICSEALRDTSSRVHEILAKAARTADAVAHWLELRGNRFIPYFKPVYQRPLLVTGSHRFPAYEINFGWEVPSAVRSCNVPADGEMVIYGGRPGSLPGDVEVSLSLPAADMRRLLRDPAFLATARSNPYFGSL